jgi:hypothetical protein
MKNAQNCAYLEKLSKVLYDSVLTPNYQNKEMVRSVSLHVVNLSYGWDIILKIASVYSYRSFPMACCCGMIKM